GTNSLYKAIPVIEKLAALAPKSHVVFGQSFFDVIQITESRSESGRTSLPGFWEANVNYRFSPHRSESEALAHLKLVLNEAGVPDDCQTILDVAPPGKVIESALFSEVIGRLGHPIKPKQAWTDVAQLTQKGIPAFNFGPGLTAQAHKIDEYILEKDLIVYAEALHRALC
ncbi:MAG: succinyl-diaminopimelate desuccinylase, partial [Candidatus Marinamargulisbacteria bacterium]